MTQTQLVRAETLVAHDVIVLANELIEITRTSREGNWVRIEGRADDERNSLRTKRYPAYHLVKVRVPDPK